MADTDHEQEPPAQANEPLPSPEPIPEHDGPDSDETADHSETEETPTIKTVEQSMLRWTRIVGFFTAVLAVVGGIQTWAFIQSERAFLAVDVKTFAPFPLQAGSRLYIQIDVKNTGRAQALLLSNEWSMISLSGSLPIRPTYLNKLGAFPGIIQQGESAHILLGPMSQPITNRQIGALQSGRTKLFIFGSLHFADDFTIFGDRQIGYCVIYNPNDPSKTPGPRLDGCGNPDYVYYR